MFGYAAFAQPTFAGLGSSNFVLFITEGFASGDSVVGGYALNITENIEVLDFTPGGFAYISEITEAFTTGDLESVAALFARAVFENILFNEAEKAVVATFITFITEALQAADTPTGAASFVSVVTENVNLADIESPLRTQYALLVEPLAINVEQNGFAWVKIDNTESTQWVLIDNRQ
jgi:ribosomal silencing factor RsfS